MTKRRLELDDFLQLRSLPWGFAPALSPSGRFFAYTLRLEGDWFDSDLESTETGAPRLAANTQVWVTDTSTGNSVPVQEANSWSWGPVWSPVEDKLAFLSDRAGSVNVWLWDSETQQAEPVSDAPVSTGFGFNRSHQWTGGGKHLVALLRPESWKPGKAVWLAPPDEPIVLGKEITVQVFNSPETEEPILQTHLPENYPDVGAIDLAIRETSRILKGFPVDTFKVSPDGNTIAFHTVPKPGESERKDERVCDLYLLKTSGGEPQLIAERLDHGRNGRHQPVWSPDSRYCAYVHNSSIMLAEPDGSITKLDTDLPIDRNFLLWNPSGQGVLAFESLDVPGAAFDQAGKCVYVSLGGGTTELPHPEGRDRVKESQYFPLITAGSTDTFWSPDGNSIIILTEEIDTRRSEFWKVPIDGGEPELLLHDERGLSLPSTSSDSNAVLTFAVETASAPHDFWLTDSDFTSPRRITTINPQLEGVDLGTTRLVSWLSPQGEEVSGVVLLPPGYKEGTRLPIVVEVYPGALMSRKLHRWDPTPGTLPIQLLASRGYGVFLPDLPISVGYSVAVEGLTDLVLGGLNEIVRLGIADPERLGVMGQSAGGLMVNRIITETTRFKAAVSSAGISDLVSLYGEFRVLGTGAGFAYGQPLVEVGMGGPPWEMPIKYVKESAIFHVDKVETPLMLIHGTEDVAVDEGQPAEMFVALRRLGKKAVFLRYRGEGHVPGYFSLPNRRDVTEKVLDWFEEHLKGE